MRMLCYLTWEFKKPFIMQSLSLGFTSFSRRLKLTISVNLYALYIFLIFSPYIQLYIQVMVTRNHLTLLKTFLQAACLVLAFFCGLSRIRDLFHHWGDVLAGFLLGAVIALCHVSVKLYMFWAHECFGLLFNPLSLPSPPVLFYG